MSPTAFKDQIAAFVTDLARCYELCDSVRKNRHLPTHTENLDILQHGIKNGVDEIQALFNSLRRGIGSRMDLGDETARMVMQGCVRDLRSEIKARLNDIAFPKKRESHESDAPGFSELYRRWRRIEQNVYRTLESLGRRLEGAKSRETGAAAPPFTPQVPKRKTEEVVVCMKELNRLTEHMKRSWKEKFVGGRVIYVNCWDEKILQGHRPDGFVQTLGRVPSWERQSPNSAW